MSKWPRIVVPGLPHHVTHRGTRRQTVFFEAQDYQKYKSLLREACGQYDVEIWAYCLMPNHVHLIAAPRTEQSLSQAIGRCHQRYAKMINARFDWRGHLWEQRFSSIPMDEKHLLMAAQYVELNPVRANLSITPGYYSWSSARSHLTGTQDDLAVSSLLQELVCDWPSFLAAGLRQRHIDKFRELEKTGYPAADEPFLKQLEAQVGRLLRPKKRGPKQKSLISRLSRN